MPEVVIENQTTVETVSRVRCPSCGLLYDSVIPITIGDKERGTRYETEDALCANCAENIFGFTRFEKIEWEETIEETLIDDRWLGVSLVLLLVLGLSTVIAVLPTLLLTPILPYERGSTPDRALILIVLATTLYWLGVKPTLDVIQD